MLNDNIKNQTKIIEKSNIDIIDNYQNGTFNVNNPINLEPSKNNISENKLSMEINKNEFINKKNISSIKFLVSNKFDKENIALINKIFFGYPIISRLFDTTNYNISNFKYFRGNQNMSDIQNYYTNTSKSYEPNLFNDKTDDKYTFIHNNKSINIPKQDTNITIKEKFDLDNWVFVLVNYDMKQIIIKYDDLIQNEIPSKINVPDMENYFNRIFNIKQNKWYYN